MEGASPTPGWSQALLEVEAVGICGSDFHIFDGTHPYGTYPLVQGHEIVGRIVEINAEPDSRLTPGDRVAVDPLLPCGHCFPCRRGHYNCCAKLEVLGVHLPGGLSDLMLAPAPNLHPVGNLPVELAVLAEPFAVGLQAITRGNVQEGDTVIVIGAGSIGRAVILAAVDRNARVLAADREPMRLDLAVKLGAERVVNTTREALSNAVNEFTGGDGAAIVIEATGASEVIREALDIVAHSGRVVIVGVSDEEMTVPVSVFTRKEITLLGSRNSERLFPEAIELVTRHRDLVGLLVSHAFSLDDTERALTFARDNPQGVSKAIIDLRLSSDPK
jgi:L-gulonate 5-dehydrogenase